MKYPSLLSVPFCLLILNPFAGAKVVYVNRAATGTTHDGVSWGSAFTSISQGLAASASGDEVWVGRGSYITKAIVPGGVALYGGFAGTETARDQRDWKANATVLDGDGLGSPLTLKYPDIVVDGFTISGGGGSRGGIAILGVQGGSVTIAHNIIRNNARGGIYFEGGTATITENTFRANAELGGIYIVFSTATIMRNIFDGNGGAGISIPYGTATIACNKFTGNRGSSGGAVQTGGQTLIASNLIVGNYADYEGAGISVNDGLATITNNTIVGNTTGRDGGGISVVAGSAVVTNNIIAFNNSGLSRFTPLNPTLTVRNNDLFGNTDYDYKGVTDPTGTGGSIKADPFFADRTGGNYHLSAGSPCIDAGYDVAVQSGDFDYEGKPRILGAHVDIGALEYEAAVVPFTVVDVSRCLSIASGNRACTSDDLARLNVDSADAGLDLRDAAHIARKAAGLDANP